MAKWEVKHNVGEAGEEETLRREVVEAACGEEAIRSVADPTEIRDWQWNHAEGLSFVLLLNTNYPNSPFNECDYWMAYHEGT